MSTQTTSYRDEITLRLSRCEGIIDLISQLYESENPLELHFALDRLRKQHEEIKDLADGWATKTNG